MIIVHKGGFNIGPKYVHIIVDVQLDENNPDEYIPGYGRKVDTNLIANKALKETESIDKNKYGIFADVIKEYIEVDHDDCYDYHTIDDMLNNRDSEHYEKWLTKYEELESYITEVEYEGKYYSCYINMFMEK